MASLKNLPPEIHEMILDSCNFSSDKTLRLTSKTLCTLTTPRVFSTIYIGFFDHSIAALNSIASHPHIACIPRKLVLCGAWMRALTFREWKTHVDITAARYYEKTREFDIDARMPDYANCRKWTSERVKFGGLSDEQLLVYWRRYYVFAMQQRKWTKLVMEREILVKPVTALTGLRSVIVPNEGPGDMRQAPEPLWLNLWTKTLVLTTWDPCFHAKDNAATWHGLLRSLMRREPALKSEEVSISVTGRRFWDYLASRRILGSSTLYQRPFRHVKDLTLDIEMNISDKNIVNIAAMEIAHWIANSQIEDLKLRIRNPMHDPCRILQYLHWSTLSELKKLCLEVECSEEEIETLLRQRGAQLKTLTIGCMWLIDSTWTKTLQSLPTWLPNLQSFEIYGPLHAQKSCFYWLKGLARLVENQTWNRQYQDYVLRKNICPTLDPDEWEQQQHDAEEEQGLLTTVPMLPAGSDESVDEDSDSTSSISLLSGVSGFGTESSSPSSTWSESDDDDDDDGPDSLDELSETDDSEEPYDLAFDTDAELSTDDEDWFDGEHLVTPPNDASVEDD